MASTIGPPASVSVGLALLARFGGPLAPFAKAAQLLLTTFGTFGTHGHRGQQRLVYAGVDPLLAARVAVWARRSYGPLPAGIILNMIASEAEKGRTITAGPGCQRTITGPVPFHLQCRRGGGTLQERVNARLTDAYFELFQGFPKRARRSYERLVKDYECEVAPRRELFCNTKRV